MSSTVNIPSDLNCPVCLDLPLDKVFQCLEGHTVCEQCYSKLSNCPQCKVEFGLQPIRSRVTEKMLDEYRCPNRAYGCTEIVDKASREKHLETCQFTESTNGKLVDICTRFGGKECSFRVNKANVTEAIKHLQIEHNVNVDGPQSHFRLPELKKMVEVTKEENVTFNSKPVILKDDEGHVVFVGFEIGQNTDGSPCIIFSVVRFPYAVSILPSQTVEICVSTDKHKWTGNIHPFDKMNNELQFMGKLVVELKTDNLPATLNVEIRLPSADKTDVGTPLDIPLSEFSAGRDLAFAIIMKLAAEKNKMKSLMEAVSLIQKERIQNLEAQVEGMKEAFIEKLKEAERKQRVAEIKLREQEAKLKQLN